MTQQQEIRGKTLAELRAEQEDINREVDYNLKIWSDFHRDNRPLPAWYLWLRRMKRRVVAAFQPSK